jgi:hypothetical protein
MTDTQTQYQRINVKTTDGSLFNGKVNITANERVSDLFRSGGDPFLVMVDVNMPDGATRTLFVNKRHVVWVEPEE